MGLLKEHETRDNMEGGLDPRFHIASTPCSKIIKRNQEVVDENTKDTKIS